MRKRPSAPEIACVKVRSSALPCHSVMKVLRSGSPVVASTAVPSIEGFCSVGDWPGRTPAKAASTNIARVIIPSGLQGICQSNGDERLVHHRIESPVRLAGFNLGYSRRRQ